MTAEQLAQRLGGVRSGRQWSCRCVAHEDRRASMIIFDGVTAVQVRCMAGCAPEDIIAELERRGLWESDGGAQAPRRQQGGHAPQVASQKLTSTKPERQRTHIAQWLWSQRVPIEATAAEHYLRKVRGITCTLPPTLAYLPARGEHGHAMIAAFGLGDTVAVHLTKLDRDGLKLEKIMVGSPRGVPIRLAPINDLLGLAICEGIEDGLSIAEATGLGVWAAGAASLMGALGDAVPDWVDCVTVITDVDKSGQQGAGALIERLLQRGIHAEAMASGGRFT